MLSCDKFDKIEECVYVHSKHNKWIDCDLSTQVLMLEQLVDRMFKTSIQYERKWKEAEDNYRRVADQLARLIVDMK